MTLLCLLIAPIRVALPPQEDVADWSSILEACGVVIADPEHADILLTAEGDQWDIVVHVDGANRRIAVSPPVSQAERRDVILLALSLLDPVTLPGWPSSVSARKPHRDSDSAPPSTTARGGERRNDRVASVASGRPPLRPVSRAGNGSRVSRLWVPRVQGGRSGHPSSHPA